MQSIRSFLFVNLVFSVIIVMAITLIGNVAFSHKIFKDNLDTRLASNVLFLNMLLEQESDTNINISNLQSSLNKFPNELRKFFPDIATKKEYFQIYDHNDNLLLKSPDLTAAIVPTKTDGFQDLSINNVLWRVFTFHNLKHQWTITASQRHDIFYVIEKHLIQDSIFITLVIIPFLSILILTIVNQGLNNIREIIHAVKHRAPNNLKPVSIKKIPAEIKPLITELNNLFIKLQEYLDREKRFAADAAHELRTPLAALKIQAQVALNTHDESELKTALRNIIKGADRSTHTVSQLLTLSRTIPEVYGKNETISLIKESQQVIIDLIHLAKQKNIDIELIAPEKISQFKGNPISISILIKNLVDNAIRYTPANGQVQVVIDEVPNNLILKVIDTGPGVPPELREKVFDRFFRVVGNKEPGSGLGLNIVKQIADLYNASIELKTPPSGIGLEIAVAFPKPQ